jgi:hypothetical protein
MDNATVQASQENQNSSTLAQMLGGISIAISLYLHGEESVLPKKI